MNEVLSTTIYRRMLHHSGIIIGITLFLLTVFTALFGPFLSTYSYSEIHLQLKNLPPCWEHIFGTDDLGRDLFTRVCYGLRISLAIGVISVIIDLGIGLVWGMVSGFCGGTIDHIMMRIADLVYSLPYLLFVILVTAICGPGLIAIIGAMVLIGWIQIARIARAHVLQMKQAECIIAAEALGVSKARILIRHIFPNIAGPMITAMMLTIPHAIFAEGFLSFLGIGVQPPLASLGSMVSDAIPALRYYPWRLFFPAGAITLIIFACNLIGDGLQEVMDPKKV